MTRAPNKRKTGYTTPPLGTVVVCAHNGWRRCAYWGPPSSGQWGLVRYEDYARMPCPRCGWEEGLTWAEHVYTEGYRVCRRCRTLYRIFPAPKAPPQHGIRDRMLLLFRVGQLTAAYVRRVFPHHMVQT